MIVACIAGLSTAMQDLTNICDNHRNGDVVVNPFDCQSYFVCNIVPKLRFCDAGLHFDSRLKLCNWPEYANCQVIRPQPTPAPVEASSDETFGWFAPKPRPSFIAIDVDTGLQTNPLAKYNPKHVECRHFGAYFLPHPRSCQRYFLCAYGHLHQHYCGRGTLWNYKREECELAAEAECYEKSSISEQQLWEEEQQLQTDNESESDEQQYSEELTMTDVSKTTAALPTTSEPSNPATVCFVVDIGYTQQQQKTTEALRSSTPSIISFSPFNQVYTTTSTLVPTSSYVFTTTSRPTTTTTGFVPSFSDIFTTTSRSTTAAIAQIQSSTARADILACPSNREAYLSHKRDCTKYFICIVGMPVLTSCPDGLYWNQKAEFCDSPKNVDCQMQ